MSPYIANYDVNAASNATAAVDTNADADDDDVDNELVPEREWLLPLPLPPGVMVHLGLGGFWILASRPSLLSTQTNLFPPFSPLRTRSKDTAGRRARKIWRARDFKLI